ncbi:hypothetical protein GIB67_014554 [Kingdonia uniflora]|uniref:Uncharacterized protein n=1 Tax=Kingdonia uniflora TaxID=39325 RepID=A0A7J7LCB6_9MAGN|nr:hypothetical protein GIB67_014554 [Kingdonia uniflora]
MRSKNPKPSSKFVVSSSSEESSSFDRTMDDSKVIGIVTVDKPAVPSGRDVGLYAGIETGQFFMYPKNVDVAKKFLQYKRSLNGKWGNYVMNAGLWFKTLVRPDGKIDHYQGLRWISGRGIWVVHGSSIPLTFFQKGVMNAPKSCPGQLNDNVFEMMKVCEALKQRWMDGGIARQFAVDDVLKYYKFKYVKDRKSGYLFSDSTRLKFFDFKSTGRPWYDHLVMSLIPKVPLIRRVCSTSNRYKSPGKISELLRVNLKAVEQEALDLAKRDPIRLDTQIRSSILQLSVAWKLAAEVLKVAATDRAEYEAEKDQIKKEVAATKKEVEDETKKAVDIVVACRNKLIQAFYFWGLSREDVDLALAGKYSEIIFLGDDASLVAEQSLNPPVADDTTKEEVVRLRRKVSEMEKALSRARDSINRTQQVHNKLEYERRLHKSNFDNTFKKLFELQCKYGKIKIERDEVLRKESDRFALLQKSLKDKRFVDKSDKLECQRSLLSLTLYFKAKVNSERGLKEAYLKLLTDKGIVTDPARVKFLAQKARNRHSIEAQRCSTRAGVSIIWGGVGPLPDELDFFRGKEQ